MQSPVGRRTRFLVDDLIPIIVDHFALNTHPSELAALALVSSSWRNPVRRALYARLRLVSYHSCYLLSRTLTEDPELGNRVRAVHLHPVSRVCLSGRTCVCRHVDAFALSLSPLFRLPRASEISLGGDFALHAEQYLRAFVNTKAVRRLHVEGMQWFWSFAANRIINPSLRWTEGLASRFRNLKELELVNLDLRISEPHAFAAHPPQLESVVMDRVRIRNGKFSDLSPNSWGNIRELTIVVSEFCSDYDVRDVLLQAASSLLAFRYIIKEDDGRSNLETAIGVDALSSCTSLQDLQLSVPFGHSTLKVLGDRLTELVSLKIYGSYEIDIEEWSTEISNGIFPRLREIHLPRGSELRRSADWQRPALHTRAIRKACEGRSIRLSHTYLPALR